MTMLSDIFPTGYHGAVSAGVKPGSTVYVAGAGPVGLAAAHSAQLLGAAVVIVGDLNSERLAQAKSFGCETVNLREHANLAEQIDQILGEPEVDCAIDCVGFEAHGHGHAHGEAPATVLNSIMEVTRAGGRLGIPGLYVTGDPGAVDEDAKIGTLKNPIRLGLGQIPYVCNRTNAGHAVSPGIDDVHPERKSPNRQSGQRYFDLARPSACRLFGIR